MKKFLLFLALSTAAALVAAVLLCLWLNASADRVVPARYRLTDSISVTSGE